MSLELRIKNIEGDDCGKISFLAKMAGIEITNPEIFKKHVVANNNESLVLLLEEQNSLHQKEIITNEYKEKRRGEYNENGLSFDRYIEMIIENDTIGIEKFKAKREEIKLKYPKP